MFSSAKLTTAALSAFTLLGLTAPATALGCYGSGLLYGDVTDDANVLVSARNSACTYFAGTYPQGGDKGYCITIGKNRINFEARNKAGTTQVLTLNDCVAALTIEMNACSHGSQQNHGSFFYNNDPNAGPC